MIVEGPDSSGKSTLVAKLGEIYGLPTFRAGPKPVDSEHSEVCMIYQCAWLRKRPCIWDRFTGISNTCNMPPLNDADIPMHAYYTKIAMEHAIVIVCTGQSLDDHTQEVYETDEDIDIMKREATQVKNNYIRMAHDLPRVITYDFKVRTLESLAEEIDHEISIRL